MPTLSRPPRRRASPATTPRPISRAHVTGQGDEHSLEATGKRVQGLPTGAWECRTRFAPWRLLHGANRVRHPHAPVGRPCTRFSVASKLCSSPWPVTCALEIGPGVVAGEARRRGERLNVRIIALEPDSEHDRSDRGPPAATGKTRRGVPDKGVCPGSRHKGVTGAGAGTACAHPATPPDSKGIAGRPSRAGRAGMDNTAG